ncbi:hypothetical protein SADO_12343 [Salinisphaera dokdonensis CL-ES53]|uniref:Uncharacterized protein n=1 Tax=Salinisphaera dokdonensis CL-ES53 TaxID=1304272 RepID=A0ABV2B3B0_9GAMM
MLLIGVPEAVQRLIKADLPSDCEVVALQHEDITSAQPDATERYDIAIVMHTLETMSPATARLLLGRLRDMLARCVVVGISKGAKSAQRWTIADFIAMGFRRSSGSRDLPKDWNVYRFDIHDYKTTPNWLSSRYWANPERWDGERW